MGQKICFNREIWLIIPKLSLLPLLIWSTDVSKSVWRLYGFSAVFSRTFSKLCTRHGVIEKCNCNVL